MSHQTNLLKTEMSHLSIGPIAVLSLVANFYRLPGHVSFECASSRRTYLLLNPLLYF